MAGLFDSTNDALSQAMTSPLFSLGLGLIGSAQPFANPAQQIQGAFANAQQQNLVRQLSPLQVQQAQQQTQMGQMGLDFQKAINHAILQRMQAQQSGLMPPAQPQQSAGLLPAAPQASGATTAAAPSAPAQSQAPTQSPQPSWLAPPSPQQISAIPVGGFDPSLAPILALKSGQDPAAAATATRTAQLGIAKQQYDPIVQALNGVVQSDNPVRDINANPVLKATWAHYAQARGLDPSKDLNAANARQVFGAVANQFRASLGEATEAPPIPLQTSTDQYGRTVQTNTQTGQQTVLPAPTLEKVVDPKTGQPTLVSESQAAGMQPYNPWNLTDQQMQGPGGQLMAQMQLLGVSFPGSRSPAQQMAYANNFMRAHPEMSPQDAAQAIYSGQLDFNGAKRSTGQLATIATAAEAQYGKLQRDFQSLDPLVQQLPNAPSVFNKAFTGLSNNLKFGGDKQSAALVGWLREVATEYAKISSGSTGSAAPAEGNIAEAVKIMQNAYTKGGYAGLKDVIMGSGEHKLSAVRDALHMASSPGFATGRNQPPASAPSTGKVLTYDPNTGTFK